MELKHLRYFLAVAEMENVSRAATQRLHVAQPSLSRLIRDLEEELGVQLFERTAKSVRLTYAGRAFLEEARAILNQVDGAMLKARAIAGKQELRVGDWSLGTGRLMPGLLRAYQQVMPNVHVKLHDWTVDTNIEGVRDARLQLAITIPPLKGNALADLRFEELATMRICLVVSSDHLVNGSGARTVHRTHAGEISSLPAIPRCDFRMRK